MPTESLFRSVLVIHEGERYRVVHRSLVEGGSFGGHRHLASLTAQARLGDWLRGPAGADLRRLGAELLGWSYSSPKPLDADRLLRDKLHRELQDFDGVLLVLEEPPTHFQPLIGAEPEEVVTEAKETTWIEVQLVDEEDEPVVGVEYEIKLPDGRRVKGRTDGTGRVRYDGIDPGSCKFSFIGLDEEAWDTA